VKYSVILPLYNESGNLEQLLREVQDVLNGVGGGYEVIFVDDGSTDSSAEVLKELKEASPDTVHVLSHHRNFGQSAALLTGLQAASGEILITLDGDGQNVPADIPLLLAELANGRDVVCGVRQHRQDGWVRHLSSRLARRVRNLLVGDTFIDSGCNFRVFRREVVRFLPAFNGVHRFVPVLLQRQGFAVVEIPVSHRPRLHGVSKYGIGNRLWRGIADCLAVRWWGKRSFPADRTGE